MSPTSNWGPQTTTSSGTETPVSVLLAGEVGQRLLTWQQAVTMDARFRVAALANDPSDLQAKLAYSPEVIIMDAMIFKGPQLLTQALTSITGAVYVILPRLDLDRHRSGSNGTARKTEGDSLGQAGFHRRCTHPGPAPACLWRCPGPAPHDRCADVLGDPQPGYGERLGAARDRSMEPHRWRRANNHRVCPGMAVARRGLRSLLVGLDAPDVMPLQLGLKSEPNILGWFTNPTDVGLKNSVQHVGDLDVLAGFPDILAEETGQKAEDKNSISSLVTTAAYGGYAAILLDAPASSSLASNAVMSANTWVLVARPTLADAWLQWMRCAPSPSEQLASTASLPAISLCS